MSRFQRNGSRNGGTATQDKKRPVHSIRRWCGAGSIEVAIFEKEIEVQGQSPMITYFATAVKSYKDDKGDYQNVSVFNPHELVILAHALNEAYAWINQQTDRE
jgi:hypothetical protein